MWLQNCLFWTATFGLLLPLIEKKDQSFQTMYDRLFGPTAAFSRELIRRLLISYKAGRKMNLKDGRIFIDLVTIQKSVEYTIKCA